MESDEALLDAWRSGDRQAGHQLFDRHSEAVYRFVTNKVERTSSEAEDLIQQVFLAAVEARDRFAGRSSFRTYLLGIARNIVLKYWEARRVHDRFENIDDLAIANLCTSPSSVVARNETERCLLEALRHVPLRDQTALELHYWEGLNAREIGEVLGLPEDTVRSRLRRAKISLGKRMRQMERFAGVPQTTDADLEQWARAVKHQLGVSTH